MALSVLDGNQSATTLSSVVTGGEHIVAHSVVSLGSTAISNINSAVSGSAVTIPGLARLGNSIASNGSADANLDFIKIGGHQDGQNQVAHIVHVSAGGAMKVDASGSSVTFSQAPVTFGAITGSASILNFPSTQTIAGTVTANLGGYSQTAVSYSGSSVTAIPVALQTNGVYGGTLLAYNGANTYLRVGLDAVGPNSLAFGGSVPISGTVTVGNSVTIGSLPAISGTVTANDSGALTIVNSSTVTKADVKFTALAGAYNPTDAAPTYTLRPLATSSSGKLLVDASSDSFGGSVVGYDGNAFIRVAQSPASVVTIGSLPAISGTVTARLQDGSGNNLTSTSIGGVQRLNVSLASAATPGGSIPTFVNVYGGTDGSAVRTISVDSTGRQNTNVQLPRVTLIDGSGTVTTANTAITVFASSSTRSYLLVQVTTGSAFVNVGATATTVNGINLTAGQGYSWETTIPQGIVSLISTTTSSRYVAKEA